MRLIVQQVHCVIIHLLSSYSENYERYRFKLWTGFLRTLHFAFELHKGQLVVENCNYAVGLCSCGRLVVVVTTAL